MLQLWSSNKNHFMVGEVHHNMRKYINGHSIRKVEDHCCRWIFSSRSYCIHGHCSLGQVYTWCGGLNENGAPGLYVWMLGASWWSCLGHAWGGETLLEKMCPWGQNCNFRFQNSLLLPVCIPCLLLVVWEVSTQRFLPPCLHPATLNSNSLQPEARLHCVTRCLGNVIFITVFKK